ncbi:hypothetical protein D3C76_1526150 [compost metagenome]
MRFIPVVQVGIKPRVPLAYCQEQGDRRQYGLTERKDDPVVNRKIVRPVQLGGFLQRIRQSVDKGTDDEDVERADNPRQDINPERADQIEMTHQHVGRDQPAGEVHRQSQEGGHELPCFEIGPA